MNSVEREQFSLGMLLSVFAMCVEAGRPRLVTAADDDYYMVARTVPARNAYDLDIWRTCQFEDASGALFALARTPGVVRSTSEYSEWQTIPTDDMERRSVCSPMWGIRSRFNYPDDYDELEALSRLARQ